MLEKSSLHQHGSQQSQNFEFCSIYKHVIYISIYGRLIISLIRRKNTGLLKWMILLFKGQTA